MKIKLPITSSELILIIMAFVLTIAEIGLIQMTIDIFNRYGTLERLFTIPLPLILPTIITLIILDATGKLNISFKKEDEDSEQN